MLGFGVWGVLDGMCLDCVVLEYESIDFVVDLVDCGICGLF